MKFIAKTKSFFIFIAVICFIIAVLFIHPEASKILTGNSFITSYKTVEMPEDWIKNPIQYDKWAENADIAITLDQHLYPALLSIINTYARENRLKIAVKEGTCGISSGLLIRKSVDIGGFCCPPGEIDRLPGLRFHTVGIGALALLVHPDNPIDNVTLDQAQRIYQNKIMNWSELETANTQKPFNAPIKAIARLHCTERPGHWCSLLGNEDLFGPNIDVVGSIQDVMLQVYNNPGAIGAAETLYMADYRYKQERLLKALKIDGISPRIPKNISSGRYPFYFTYNITTWEQDGVKNPAAHKLLDYIIKQAENIDSSLGIVPASDLRKAGWIFKGNELVGEPRISDNRLNME
jgi:ABC-type phosphate transport system substrate-binding protein